MKLLAQHQRAIKHRVQHDDCSDQEIWDMCHYREQTGQQRCLAAALPSVRCHPLPLNVPLMPFISFLRRWVQTKSGPYLRVREMRDSVTQDIPSIFNASFAVRYECLTDMSERKCSRFPRDPCGCKTHKHNNNKVINSDLWYSPSQITAPQLWNMCPCCVKVADPRGKFRSYLSSCVEPGLFNDPKAAKNPEQQDRCPTMFSACYDLPIIL